MKKLLAVAFGVLALVCTGVASATTIGFSEDATKYADDGGAALFTEMNKLGPTMNRVTVLWNADQPTVIQDQAYLDRMIPVAKAHNIEIVFAIYPSKPSQAPTTQSAADSFCSYAVSVMQRYPYVRKVIIGNEPNQPRFWQPIWNGSQPASPAAMEIVLADCYDKLKAFDSSLDVIGVGLSPRGNDDPTATSNASISPVRWIAALGNAYRASGRTRPLFDEFAWHCYPNVNTDSVETGYAWPNAGCVNSARIKLALYDAFHGTAQPQLAAYSPDTTGTDLFGTTSKQFIDEAGWQVDTTGLPGYTGTENVPTVTEAQQAIDYEKLVHLANCEPTLSAFNIFHEIDEADRTGFQSGVLRIDPSAPLGFSERPSATDPNNSVQHAMAADGGVCKGGVWQTLGSFLYSKTAVNPLYKTFPYQNPQPLASKTISGGGIYVALQAGEGFTYQITFKNGTKTQTATGAAPKTTATAKVPTGFGSGTATIVLTAETNTSRQSTVTLDLKTGKVTSGGGSSGNSSASLALSPSPLVLGDVAAGTSGGKTVRVRVTNRSRQAIRLGRFGREPRVASTGKSEITIDTAKSTCSVGLSLAAGASCFYVVKFQTPTAGVFGATLEIAGGGLATLSFTGTGVGAAKASIADVGTVSPGTSPSFLTTDVNSGGSVLLVGWQAVTQPAIGVYCLTPDASTTMANGALIVSLGGPSPGFATSDGFVSWAGYCSFSPLEYRVDTASAYGDQFADGIEFTAIVVGS